MKYDVGITKDEINAEPGAALTARNRKDAIRRATGKALESFDGAELCPIEVETFHEYTPADTYAARIVLNIVGLGLVQEVTQ